MAVPQQPYEDDAGGGAVSAEAGQIRAHLDAELTQLARRPQPRAHQERGRMQAAGGEDELAGTQLSLFSLDSGSDADDAAALEHEAGRGGPVDDRQIAARAHGRHPIAD